MMPSTLSSTWSSSSSAPITLPLTTSAMVRDIEADIREFWSAFPCPPPWKPHLLIEVNSSRLDPHVSRTVQTFLAGKCDIQHVLTDPTGGSDPRDFNPDLDLRPTDSSDAVSSVGDPSTSEHSWCDTACQLSIGCAIFFVVVAMMVAVLFCVTKHRVRHKMAAARPSRQQLQLSASTSDAVNCTDFSNLEVQGEEDIHFPPFRHRGLPHPPITCHPSCDPKWNCPNCSPCHPLMRMSPPGQYYSRAYTAVYETIDDDDDDPPRCDNDLCPHSRGITHINMDSRNSCRGCLPCPVSPTSVSTVRIRPRSGELVSDGHQMAETGFNGEEQVDPVPRVTTLPRYFELEHDCALTGQCRSMMCPQAPSSTLGNPTSSSERQHLAFCNPGYPNPPVSYHYTNLAGTPLHSYVMSQAQQRAVPSAGEFYRAKTNLDPFAQFSSSDDTTQVSNSHPASTRQHSGPRLADSLTSAQHGSFNIFNDGPGHQASNLFGNHAPQNINHAPENFNHAHENFNHAPLNAATSSFQSDIPNHYVCQSCHQSQAADLMSTQDSNPNRRHPLAEGETAPDLLNEAANHSRNSETRGVNATSPSDSNEEDNEVPLRKPVLALHSQYFAKTSAA